ncbi:hypothetical protein [Nocardioides dilutus]
MTTPPETLLAFDRAATWPESRGVLRRVAGPAFTVPEGETLSWFDPIDGRPDASSEIAAGPVTTFATAVEWPEGYPAGMSGAAVGVGDPAMVVAWASMAGDDGEPAWFSTDRGVGCVVISRHLDEVVQRLEDFSFVRTLVASVYASVIHPLEVEGEVVGVAFNCGMGASTNWLHVGRDAEGRVVAVLADLDVLTRATLAPA